MFTTMAFFAIAVLGWLATRTENKERQSPKWLFLQLPCSVILVMLGIIADKI